MKRLAIDLEKYLQKSYLIKGLCSESMMSPKNPMLHKQATKLKNGQKS